MAAYSQLYELLGISPSSTTEEISRSYRKLALKYHPDKTNHDNEMTEKFKEMTRAYEILKDPKKRKIYDEYGEEGLDGSVDARQRSSQTQAFGFPNAADIFSQVFDDFNSVFDSNTFGPFSQHFSFGAGRRQQGNFKKHVQPAGSVDGFNNNLSRGQDIHHTCKVNLADLYYGKVVKFKLPRNCKCSACDGMGGLNPRSCKQCKGSGRVAVTFYNQFSQYQEVSSCKNCSGTGVYFSPNTRCTNCNQGYLKELKIITVNILPGMKDNDKIVLYGQADEGKNIVPGDLVIHLQEVSHPSIVRRFNDLYVEQTIDLKTALLGGEVLLTNFVRKGENLKVYINVHGIENLYGSDSAVKEGEVVGTINPGDPKLVKGFGMPITRCRDAYYQNGEDNSDKEKSLFDLGQYERGDLFINFKIVMPSLSEFKDSKNLLALRDILPDSVPTANRNASMSAHLSNLPSSGYSSSDSESIGNQSSGYPRAPIYSRMASNHDSSDDDIEFLKETHKSTHNQDFSTRERGTKRKKYKTQEFNGQPNTGIEC